MKTQFRYIVPSVLLLGVVAQMVIAAPPLSFYTPGETTDPTCSPGDTNCDVTLTGLNTDDQSLSLSGSNLSIEDGNSVDIYWSQTGAHIYRDTGNVGIGSNYPKALLHLESASPTIRATDNNNTASEFGLAGIWELRDADDVQIMWAGNGSGLSNDYSIRNNYGGFAVYTGTGGAAAQALHIDTTGDVGIGTTIPSDGTGSGGQDLELDVHGAIGANYYCDQDGVNCVAAANIGGSGDNIYTANGITGTGRTVGITDTLNFDSNTLFVDGVNDRVGIGTTVPDSKLEVVGVTVQETSASAASAITGVGTSSDLKMGVNHSFSIHSAQNSFIQSTTGAADLRLLLNPEGGNVGIGVANPGSNLTVLTDGGPSGGLSLVSPAGTTLGKMRSTSANRGVIELFDENSTNVMDIRAYNDSGAITMRNALGDVIVQLTSFGDSYIDTNNNFGIGNATPGSKLSVVGLPSGTSAAVAGMDSTVSGAVCIMADGDMYIDTDGTCN